MLKKNNIKFILFILLNLFITNLFAQITFNSEQIISQDVNDAQDIFAADLDNDGDLDVLSASSGDDKIAWYENLDGLGNFGTQQIITTSSNYATVVRAKDLDGDGFLDIISASSSDDTISWFKNDGVANFGVEQIITTDEDWVVEIFIADIDNDGDSDIISAAYDGDTIGWFENDGLGNFSNKQMISSNVDGPYSVFAIDLDGDNDMDIISASAKDDKIAWYQNLDGLGSFGAQQIISNNADFATAVFGADIDGDSDIDVFSSSAYDDKIAWYQNNGSGTFGTEQIISTSLDYINDIYAADLDLDGDIDLISASYIDNRLAWYENTNGLGNFTDQTTIAVLNFPVSVIAADMDGDNDADVLYADFGGSISGWDRVSWFENVTQSLSVSENVIHTKNVYPNPVKNMVNIKSNSKISKIELYNNQGQLILKNKNLSKLDLTNISNGIYFIKYYDINGKVKINKLIKESLVSD